jgi:NAD(P)H-dependent flavin oxidoreductase YrpB (nitropropane dioxygenase family)
MIKTPICDLLGIEHPIVLGGMGGGYTQSAMVAAVSNAGGLGTLGCHGRGGDQIGKDAAAIRDATNQPFALNFLLFSTEEDSLAAALEARPAVMSYAWPSGDQDIKPYVRRAHDAGAKVTYMAGSVAEALRGTAAGADIIVAQGTEGGGHVSWMASLVLTPLVVDAVAPIPVLAAGGFADGRGLAAALALGADGVLLGTRFLASDESPIHDNFKRAIVDSDGHDTCLTEIPDLAAATVWPGAMSRSRRNRLIERWSGREWALRQHQGEALAGIMAARQSGDIEEAPLSYGQDAGLIHAIMPCGAIVRQIAEEAEQILAARLPELVQ